MIRVSNVSFGNTTYALARGEIVGAYKDYSYPVGHAWRDGVLPDGVDHENNGRVGIWLRNCCLPNVSGYIPRGYYSFGFSTKAVMHKCRVISDGAEFGGVIHMIGRASDWTTAAGTVTLSGGAISGNPTLTAAGSRYFRAAQAVVQGASGGLYLSGARVHSVMEASTVDTIASGGAGHKANDVLTFDDIQYTVATVDANGTILTGSITNRGSTTDPTVCVGAWGNRREQTATTGSGTGASFIFDFRVKSWVTDAAGSGGPASANLIVRPSTVKLTFKGTWKTYNRIGIQDTVDSYLQWGEMLQDTTKSLDGTGCAGGHFDGNDNFRCDYLYVEDTTQSSGQNYGWAALAIATSSPFLDRKMRIERLHIKNAAWHGLALNGDLSYGSILIEGAGRDSSNTTTAQFGSAGLSSDASAFLWYRGNLEGGPIHITINQETIGTGFGFPLRCISTGLSNGTGTSVADNTLRDSKDGLRDSRNLRSSISSLTINNICRKGVTFGDRDSNDNTFPANVHVGSLYAHLSASVAMTSGYQMVHVENIGGGSLLKNIFDCDHAEFITHDIVERTDTLFANCFFSDTNTQVRFGKVHFPLHGSGILMELKGQHDVVAVADQSNNLGLPTSSTNPMFKVSATVGSRLRVVADSGANHMQQQVVLATGTVDCEITVKAANYRNKKLVQFDGNHTRLKVSDCAITGLSGSEDGFYFNGGTFTDCLVMGNVITACGGIGANDNGSTWSNCNGLANRLFSNGTDSNLGTSTIANLGASSTLAA
jgi:hypothetical protein